MPFLFVALDPETSVTLLRNCPEVSVRLDGQVFRRRPTQEVVFYDWLADAGGALRGLEIHVPSDDAIWEWRAKLSKSSSVDTTHCFPRILLFEIQEVAPLGKEAFNDLFFFEDEYNRPAIVVGIDDWVTATEREHLLQDLGFAAGA